MEWIRHPEVTDAEIRELYEQGLSLKAIGQRVGMNHVSVWQRMQKAGIPTRPRKTRLTRELLTPLVEQGLSTTRISEIAGVTPGMIGQRLRALGLEARDGRQGARRKRLERVYFSGYVMLYQPDHPHADKRGRVMEHRLVMEQKIGRLLEPQEVVHHMNHVRDDNRPENLMLLDSQAAHMREHHPKGKAFADGNAGRWGRKP